MASPQKISQIKAWQLAAKSLNPGLSLICTEGCTMGIMAVSLSKRGVLLSSVYISVHSRGHAMLQCLPDSRSVPTPGFPFQPQLSKCS